MRRWYIVDVDTISSGTLTVIIKAKGPAHAREIIMDKLGLDSQVLCGTSVLPKEEEDDQA